MKNETIYSTSELERVAFLEIYDSIKVKEGHTKHLHITYLEDNTHFDTFMHIYDEEGRKISSNIFEIKCRNKHYNTLMLEKYKYNKLKELKKKEQESFDTVNIYYINFTPKGTYIFDLEKVNIEWTEMYLQRSQVFDNGDKLKTIANLDIRESKNIEFIFDKDKVSNDKVKEQFKKQKIERCIFESIKKLR